MYKLVIKDDEGNKTVIAFYRQEVSVGRKAGSTIRLTEKNVSRNHAKFTKENNNIFIEDQDSYVGTFLNGNELEKKEKINNGDQVLVGDYIITLINEISDDEETVLVEEEETAINEEVRPVPISNVSEKSTFLKPPFCRLVFLDNELAGRTYEINSSKMTIGEDLSCDISIKNKKLSRKHLHIKSTLDKSVTIKDLTGKGISVNGENITKSKLNEGDLVKISDLTFRFCNFNSRYYYDDGVHTAPQTKDNKKLIIIIASVILLIIASIFVWKMLSKNNKNTEKNNDKEIEKTEKKEIKTKEEINTKNKIMDPEMLNLKNSLTSLVKLKNWERAKGICLKILKKEPNNEETKQQLEYIESRLKYKKVYHDAVIQITQNKYSNAINSLEALPKDSKYYESYKSKKKVFYEKIKNETYMLLDKKKNQTIMDKLESNFDALRLMNPAVMDKNSKDRDDDIIRWYNAYKKSYGTYKKKRPRKRPKRIRNRNRSEMFIKEYTRNNKFSTLQKAQKADYTNPSVYYFLSKYYNTMQNKSKARANYINLVKYCKKEPGNKYCALKSKLGF